MRVTTTDATPLKLNNQLKKAIIGFVSLVCVYISVVSTFVARSKMICTLFKQKTK